MARIPLALGAAAVAAGVAAYLKRRTAGPTAPAPLPAPAVAEPGQAAAPSASAPAPAVSNFDAPGPPANTATHVPAPEPLVHDPSGGIDEAAEEAAAAAEAANIGGGVPDYPGEELGEPADEEERPLIESGEGESEGQEVAEWDLADNAEPSAGDPIEGGRQIDDVIEEQDDPFAGEQLSEDIGAAPPSPDQRVEGVLPPSTPAPADDDTLAAGTLDDGAPTTGGTPSGAAEEQPTLEQPKPGDDDGSEWQTWSGRAGDS